MTATVLLVDDDTNALLAMTRLLRHEPYRLLTAGSGGAALELIRAMKIQVVVSDERMPGMSGVELLSHVRRESPETTRIMLTGVGRFETALDAINVGAIYRFFTKPYNDIELGVAIRQAVEHGQLIEEARRLLKAVREQSFSRCELEKEFPGISQVHRSRSGAVLIEETSIVELTNELREESTRLSETKNL